MNASRKRTLWVAAAILLCGGSAGYWFMASDVRAADGSETDSGTTVRRHTVVLTTAERHAFESALQVQGNVQAKRFADVPSRVFGPLDAVMVDEGDTVQKDKTPLFQVDHENLQRAVLVAEQDLAVARCSERESEANLDIAEANLEKAATDYARFQRLREKNAATQETLEQQETRHKQAVAQRKYAEAVVDLTRERTRQAEIALGIARKNLSDSLVLAPMDGVVTRRMSEPGEIAEPGKAVVRIEDMATLEASAFLPSQAYPQVTAGETQVRVVVAALDAGTHPISFKSPTIQPTLRTFGVECLLEDPPEGIAPGALAEMTVVLDGREGLGVPRDAVQLRNDESVVFVVENDRAKMVPVETGLVSNGWIEIRSGIEAGAHVVTTGQYMLDDGSAVTVREESR